MPDLSPPSDDAWRTAAQNGASLVRTHTEPVAHPWLLLLCSRIHAMTVGRRAEELLGEGLGSGAAVGVWVPPAWAWLRSRISLGRKEIGSDGSQMLMPVRVLYAEEPIMILQPGSDVMVEWTAVGLGHSAVGQTAVHASRYGCAFEEIRSSAWGVPSRVSVPVFEPDDRFGVERVLTELADAGTQARWALLSQFERYVTDAVHAAHTSIALEIEPFVGERMRLLDDSALETAVTNLLFGEVASEPDMGAEGAEDTGGTGSRAQTGVVIPLLERCMKPGMFVRTEPIKYIRDSLRRDANQELRRLLGDPHVGPKIRKVATEAGTRDAEAVVEAYRKLYPKDRVGIERVKAALSVGPDLMALCRTPL